MENQILENAANDKIGKNEILENSANDKMAEDEKHEIWEKRRMAKKEKKRERRERLKNENPAEYKIKVSEESKKKQERRQKSKLENPKEHAKFLAAEKEKRMQVKIHTWHDLFDSLYHENKHTFPTPVSKTLWEKLKNQEIAFLNSSIFSNSPISTNDLISYRQSQLDFLKLNPNFPHGGSVIFYIKTMVHRPKDQRIITPEEVSYINSLILPPLNIDDEKKFRRHCYYEKSKEKEIELAKNCYGKTKSERMLYNLNVKFMKADPNKVLSVNDIISNPFVSNFSNREEFKINLWKNLTENEKPEFLEKWEKQRKDYEKIVEDLPEEYKKNFLEQMKDKDYFEEWENRKERYLNHFRVK